jgi:hypothetical protein
VAASDNPAPAEPALTAEWLGRGRVRIANHQDVAVWVTIEWQLLQPDLSWHTYYSEGQVIGGGATAAYHPDCVFPGRMRTLVPGHGLRYSETGPVVGYCF